MLEFIVRHSQPDGRKSRCEDNGKQKNDSQVVSSNTVWHAVNGDTTMADNQKDGLQEHSAGWILH